MMRTIRILGVLCFTAVALNNVEAAKRPELSGVLAISSGDAVFMLDPTTGSVRDVETGPVGFLFPAPAGVLFAPDLIHGNTTVIDVRHGRVSGVLPGVTLPRFGPWNDRYLIVAGALTIVSYPERAPIFRMEGDFKRPWQVEIGRPMGGSLLILERDPNGADGSVISAVDLGSREVVGRRGFEEDLLRFTIVSEVGLMAVADATKGVIRLLDPATFLDVAELVVDGGVADVISLTGKKDLFAVGSAAKVFHWHLKSTDEGLTAEADEAVEIPGAGVRMVLSRAGDALAVVTDKGHVVVIDPKRAEVIGSWDTGATPRDLVWFDLSQRGPVLPSWSDGGGGGPEEVDLSSGTK